MKTMKTLPLLLLAAVLLIAGCSKKDTKLPVSAEKVEAIVSPLIDKDGTEIGNVTMSEDAKGVTISIEAEGLPPGLHGVHIHETAVCTPPTFESAGSHFNPTKKEHGFDNPKGFHLGDLPNVEVGEDGKVEAQVTTADLTLKPGADMSLLDKDGSALVIHEGQDDYKTDPAGNSGARIACAEINKK
ncbi:superoxide dismutase-like protein YojM [Sporosarcina sp. NCCP-2222]|uniref:superoxide dismutase family protein n=1 Tax=Sporosarcina sp. NCCP-2222 TaxID=2935073 RepID=UPI0020886C67|nr:superoxide dismutase family protein [Sporosarcina sp. NCCP-2222]GKV54942.1 superoxide dismutase-like protein YojM [Sporosarcina sp. NCCP-2222]